MTELILENLTPVIIAIVGAIGLKWQNSTNVKVVKKIDTLQEQVNRITITLEINKQNEEYLKILIDVKNHDIKKFECPEYKNFANFAAEIYINTIKTIIENCEISVVNYDAIEATLKSSWETVKHEMTRRFGKNYAEIFIGAVSPIARKCISDFESIITDTENHRKEKFIRRANIFLRDSLKILKKCEISL